MEMAPADAPPPRAAKRKRDDEEAILEPAWFTADAQEKLRAEYAASGPYAHAVLSPLALDARLADVRRECVSELKATFKETDLFKVFQVPHDLSALEDSAPEVAARVPSLLALRDALYAPRICLLASHRRCSHHGDTLKCVAVYTVRLGCRSSLKGITPATLRPPQK